MTEERHLLTPCYVVFFFFFFLLCVLDAFLSLTLLATLSGLGVAK